MPRASTFGATVTYLYPMLPAAHRPIRFLRPGKIGSFRQCIRSKCGCASTTTRSPIFAVICALPGYCVSIMSWGCTGFFGYRKGLPATKVSTLSIPADELYAILSLESHRHKAGVVGENLGVVPPVVNAAMARHNIQKMYVMQYEIVGSDVQHALRRAPSGTVATLNTHDMPPFRAFLDGTDIEDRLDLSFINLKEAQKERRTRATNRKALTADLQQKGFLKPGRRPAPQAIYRAALEFLAASKADIVLLNLEDLWQETQPQNVPATQHERPNWQRRAKLSIEQIRNDPALAKILSTVDRGRKNRL